MKFEVLKAEPGRAGVANEGYWGIPLAKGATYELSFYARKDGALNGEDHGHPGERVGSALRLEGDHRHHRDLEAVSRHVHLERR